MGPANSFRRPEPTQLEASVVVLGYNGRQFLEKCLSSVLDQDLALEKYEVLYVDNASQDGSVALVKERFPQVKLAELDRNYGYAQGNNIAFEMTRGEFVVFLNQDTVAARSWLRQLVEGMRSSPEIMAGHANIIHPWYPEYGTLSQRAEVAMAYTPDLTRLAYCSYRRLGELREPVDVLLLSGACLVIRRSVVDELGYIFDPEFFAYAEDWDLGLRIRALNYRCVLVPAATVYHKYRPKTKMNLASLRTTVRNLRNRYLAFFKVMHWWEFALMSMLLTITCPLNAFEFGLRRWQRAAFAVALAPVSIVALTAAVWSLPRYMDKRKDVRHKSARKRAWCLATVLAGGPGARAPGGSRVQA